jgi:hypothetical protein
MKIAAEHGVGSGTVQRIKAEMTAAATDNQLNRHREIIQTDDEYRALGPSWRF